ncbi:dipeptidase PepE [Leekyejoonella antrihumi]|uniref:Dipeptidase PepE n=1 Tax=Leekyejoonella antrihumi TaxID=1660198 RepID=A0A563E7W3_9MICO|nr:dipeptidase PepE [Leekyejoonella antrihumi]TWP38333.1 dipeptidase PepE [Leekyejoonella antrihumi]
MRLLLMSNGSAPGGEYLAHAMSTLRELLAGVDRIAFIAYAQLGLEEHTRVVAAAMAQLDVELVGVHRSHRPASIVEAADAVFVGGGNAFRLLAALHRYDLIDPIRAAVRDGAPYLGSSAGTNMACPSLRTTNDMPIVEPPTFAALNLVPFQINPHYPATEVMGRHLGETRDHRIAEFLEENDVPVLGLQEGSWLQVDHDRARLGGVAGARLFRREEAPVDLKVGADLSDLLTTLGTFDSPGRGCDDRGTR